MSHKIYSGELSAIFLSSSIFYLSVFQILNDIKVDKMTLLEKMKSTTFHKQTQWADPRSVVYMWLSGLEFFFLQLSKYYTDTHNYLYKSVPYNSIQIQHS